MLKYYWFVILESREEILCQAADLKTAYEILELEGFSDKDLGFYGIMSDYSAEMSGLDVY